MEWEAHKALCDAGNLSALLAHLEIEHDPIERDCFYIASFHMTYRDHPEVAREIVRRYIDEFSRNPFPFTADTKPDARLLKWLALDFSQDDESEDTAEVAHNLDLAIWVCQIALHFGVTDDGTKKGFAGRMASLQEARDKLSSS